jgi:hypothetical protein
MHGLPFDASDEEIGEKVKTTMEDNQFYVVHTMHCH